MPERHTGHAAPLSVFGFSLGWAVATFILRLALIPMGFLFGRTTNWLLAEGGNTFWFVSRSLLWALVAAIAAAIAAVVHNEFIKRSL